MERTGNEILVLSVLKKHEGKAHIDDISKESGLNISDTLVTLLNLEFKEDITQLPGKKFELLNKTKILCI